MATGGAGGRRNSDLQRLLSTYRWDADLVRDDLRDYVVEQLGAADGVLVVDETGFLKKGSKSVGVQRQYSGTAGRIAVRSGYFWPTLAPGEEPCWTGNCICQVWAEDWERRKEAGVPGDVSFRTKPRLAQEMLERALEAGVPFAWVTGDAVYGSDRRLRMWLEQKGMSHVLDQEQRAAVGLAGKGPPPSEGGPELRWLMHRIGNGAARAMAPRVPGFTIGPGWSYGP